MAKLLVTLHNSPDHIANAVRVFEKLGLNPSIDVQYVGQLVQKKRQLLQALRLDPKDTHAKELYFSLRHKFLYDDEHFMRSIGLTPNAPELSVANKIAEITSSVALRKRIFAPKKTALKRIIKAKPPKRAMKLLHYRSVDSALRRCELPVLISAIELSESQKWLDYFFESVAKLQYNDYEERPVEVCATDDSKWDLHYAKLIERRGHAVLTAYLAGGIVIIPNRITCAPGQASLFLFAVLQGIIHLRTHSSHKRHTIIQAEQVFSQALEIDPLALTVNNLPISWSHIHKALEKNPDLQMLFEPDLTTDHISGDNFAVLLQRVSAVYEFWLPYLSFGVFSEDGKVCVSGNVLDVAVNTVYQRPYGSHSTACLYEHMNDDLHSRYFSVDPIKSVLKIKLAPINTVVN